MGFRFTAREFADELGVYGWVKNLADGRVEIVAEAEEEVLQGFLARMNEYFSRYLQNTELSWSAASGEFRDFQVTF